MKIKCVDKTSSPTDPQIEHASAFSLHLKYTFETFIKNHKVLMREYITSNQFIKQLAYKNPRTQYFSYIVHKHITDYRDKPYATAMISSIKSIMKGIRKNQLIVKFILDNGAAVYVDENHDAFYFRIRNCLLHAEKEL